VLVNTFETSGRMRRDQKGIAAMSLKISSEPFKTEYRKLKYALSRREARDI